MKNLEFSYREAEAITQLHAKSFYFSSRILGKERRRAAFAVYAFCRHADDRIDETPAAELDSELRNLRSLLDECYQGKAVSELKWTPAFVDTIQRYELERKPFDELLEGMAFDSRGTIRIQSREELNRYCYWVAGVVGLQMAKIFGLRDKSADARALDLGWAMQLTNILRDVREDYLRDRIYLPADELRAAGIGDLGDDATFRTEAWKNYARSYIATNREIYSRCEAGIKKLSWGAPRICVWSMRKIYAAILDEIEKADYDVSARRSVSLSRKMTLGLGAILSGLK